MAERALAGVIAASEAGFGTSGVRGKVEALDDSTVFAFTAAFLHHLALPAGTGVHVGHDLRPSSPHIAQGVIAAVAHCGLTPRFAGEISTPALAFCALSAAEAAVMVTGSHIPFDRNGIKFYRPDGEMTKDDEAPVLNCDSPFPFDGANLLPLPDTDPAAARLWQNRYRDAFPDLLDGLTIGHWQHSAAGRDDLAELLSSLGAAVVPLGRSETFVAVDTEAVGEEERALGLRWAHEHKLDAIVATDGDGDRPLLADESGRWFRGDALGILTARALSAQTVVTPVSSTTAVEKSGFFEETIRTKIGSPHVIAAMAGGSGTVAGFEANGGFLLGSVAQPPGGGGASLAPLPTRDAVLPMLATIALARQHGDRLSALHALLPARATASDRLQEIARDVSQELIAGIDDHAGKLAPEAGAVTERGTIDGTRLTYEDGSIVHLRPSGNAPELRVYVEATSESGASALLEGALAAVRNLLPAR